MLPCFATGFPHKFVVGSGLAFNVSSTKKSEIFVVIDHFITRELGRKHPSHFITVQSEIHPTIPFTSEHSYTGLSFLDTAMFLENVRLIITLYRKLSQQHYLYHDSRNPKHRKISSLSVQATGLRRICVKSSE